jgi:uncharacterized membrane protein YfcA
MIPELFIVFISQVLFNILKVWEIKYTYLHKTGSLLLNSVFINLISLSTTYISVTKLMKGEWVIIFFYVIGSVVGKYIGMEMQHKLTFFKKIKNYEKL